MWEDISSNSSELTEILKEPEFIGGDPEDTKLLQNTSGNVLVFKQG